MNLGDITVKKVAKDFDPEASLSELEIFHTACGGGKIKTERVEGWSGIKWEVKCLRCGESDTIHSPEVAKIFKVATQGKQEQCSVGPFRKISPK